MIIAWIVRPMNAIHRAGFSLSRAPFRKMEKLATSCQFCSVTPIYFLLKNRQPFFLITVVFFISLVHSGVAHYFGMFLCCKKITAPLMGALFCGGPCLAEHAEHA